MCFVPFKRFISYRIGAHGRTSVITGGGQRPRRRPSLALIPPAAPAPPIYEVMGDHGSPVGTSVRLSLSRGYRWSLYLNIYVAGDLVLVPSADDVFVIR